MLRAHCISSPIFTQLPALFQSFLQWFLRRKSLRSATAKQQLTKPEMALSCQECFLKTILLYSFLLLCYSLYFDNVSCPARSFQRSSTSWHERLGKFGQWDVSGVAPQVNLRNATVHENMGNSTSQEQAISNFTRNGFVGSDLWVYWNHLDVHRHLPRTL